MRQCSQQQPGCAIGIRRIHRVTQPGDSLLTGREPVDLDTTTSATARDLALGWRRVRRAPGPTVGPGHCSIRNVKAAGVIVSGPFILAVPDTTTARALLIRCLAFRKHVQSPQSPAHRRSPRWPRPILSFPMHSPHLGWLDLPFLIRLGNPDWIAAVKRLLPKRLHR